MSVDLIEHLNRNSATWLVTGAAGFIGSNICEFLVNKNQRVIAFDSLATGHLHNIEDVKSIASRLGRPDHFTFVKADITDAAACNSSTQGVDYVLHQAALGSVPRSIKTPLDSHHANVDGFINILNASVIAKVKRFVYASSSSVYGDSPELPKVEARTGNLLSPYAATKAINETYAAVFQQCYGLPCVGLRYFNVFGKRQDPNGPYAAVIPRWLLAMLQNQPVTINGDGQTSRDFCYIDNVVQANILSALAPQKSDKAEVLNVAFGEQTELLTLAQLLRSGLANAMQVNVDKITSTFEFKEFRTGDIRYSLADISKAKSLVGYAPTHSLEQGLINTCQWYLENKDRLK